MQFWPLPPTFAADGFTSTELRITVHRIAVLYKQGQSPEDIVQTYPHLSLGQVYAALAYYHANRAEIESELAAADVLYDELRGQGTGRGNAP